MHSKTAVDLVYVDLQRTLILEVPHRKRIMAMANARGSQGVAASQCLWQSRDAAGQCLWQSRRRRWPMLVAGKETLPDRSVTSMLEVDILFAACKLYLPSSSVFVSYFILAVHMRTRLGKHSCMSSPISFSHTEWYLFFYYIHIYIYIYIYVYIYIYIYTCAHFERCEKVEILKRT